MLRLFVVFFFCCLVALLSILLARFCSVRTIRDAVGVERSSLSRGRGVLPLSQGFRPVGRVIWQGGLAHQRAG